MSGQRSEISNLLGNGSNCKTSVVTNALTYLKCGENKGEIKTDITTDNTAKYSGKLDNRFDKEKVQKELDYQVKAITDFQKITAVQISKKVAERAEALNQEADKLEAQGKGKEAEQMREQAQKWEVGGSYRKGIDSLTNAIGLALGGSLTEGIIAGAASPYVNSLIKQGTEDNKTANLVAHTVWGAIEAHSQGGTAISGAAAALSGEVVAGVISKALYNQETPTKLTEEQKQHVSELSQLVAGVAGGITSSATGNNRLSTAQNAQIGMQVAKSAVENNNFGQSYTAWKKEEDLREKDPEAYAKLKQEQLETFKEIGSFGLDFVPVLGDAKSFAEAEDRIDYTLAVLGTIPGAKLITKSLKEAKIAYLASRKAEQLGNLVEAKKYLDEANALVNRSLTGIYDSKEIRQNFEQLYGKEKIVSTTVPPLP